MPAFPSSQSLKAMVIDVVSSGDARLQSLLIENIDAMWALNQRHGYNRVVQYLYTQAEALRFGMEFFRTQIDVVRTESEARSTRSGRVNNQRTFVAQHSETRNQLTIGAGSGASSNNHHTHTDESANGSETGYAIGNHSVLGEDHSITTYVATRNTGEHGTADATDKTLFSDSQIDKSGIQDISGTSIDPASGGNYVDYDINIKDFLVPVRFAYADGNVTHKTHLTRSAGGTVAPGDGITYSEYNLGDRFLTIDDAGTTTQRGNLNAENASEIGTETDTNSHNITRTGGGQLETSHSRAMTRSGRTEVTGALLDDSNEDTSVDGQLSSLSHSVDTTHGETHDLGQSNAQLLGTIDYFSQLFENLKMLYESVMQEIKNTEQQIGVPNRYIVARLTTQYVTNNPCGARSNNPVLRGVPRPNLWPRPV